MRWTRKTRSSNGLLAEWVALTERVAEALKAQNEENARLRRRVGEDWGHEDCEVCEAGRELRKMLDEAIANGAQNVDRVVAERDDLIDWIGNHVVIDTDESWAELPECAKACFRERAEP